MSWFETLRTGLEAVRSHRLRSALTVLGIMIGIAAVILTVGLGQGAQDQVKSAINSLGTNLLTVSPGSSTSSSGFRQGFGTASTLTLSDADALSSKVVAPDIKAVAPVVSAGEPLSDTVNSNTWTTTVVGTTPTWEKVRNRTVSQGRFIDGQDVTDHTAVAVIGADTASELFGGIDPVGQVVDVNGVPVTVVGVLNPVGDTSSTTGSNQDDQLIVPMTTATQRLFGTSSLSSILIEATSGSTLSAAYQEADAELLALHGITTPAAADFTVASQQSLVTTATSVDRTLTVLLGGIAGISLLVGGIGVMNIMLVSVTERVREIGLRKALGAKPAVIRRQFLLEASVLGLSGGAVGAALAVIGTRLLPRAIGYPVALSLPATGLAIAVAVAIGIIFGVYPASRAARLAPIDALRNE
ncbi:MAG TPA: ABC transporter permease [Acidimicrobiales bacterium]|nr:ABC transporter permease [Acidimicrobiales bacterium]